MYDILVKVGADVTQFSKNMKGVSKSLSDISGNANKITFGKLVGAVGITAALAKGFNMVKNSVGGAVDRLDTLNNFPRVMERVGFSAEQSQKSINRLSDGIDGLPTTLDDVASTAQRIAIMTKDLDGAVDTTLALNNAFLASGSDSANASRGLEQYVQMLSKGKVDLQSWRTLQETMGVALNDVAESFGFAGASAQNDLYDALKKGNITFDDFNGRIVEMSNKTGGFADIARDASGGIKTAWTNVQTAITRGVANVIKAFDEFLGTTSLGSIEQIFIRLKGTISDFFNRVAENIPVIINKFREFYEMISPFIPLITRLATGIGIFLTALAGLNSIINIVASVIGFLGTNLGTLAAVFSFIISPIGLTILAIAGLVAAFVIAYNKVEWFRDFVDKAWAKIKEYFGIALDWIIDKVKVIMTEVWNFIKEILGKITAFWKENGAQIMAYVKLVFGGIWEYIKMVMGWIKGIFEIIWPIIKALTNNAWQTMKLMIKNTLDIILGIIRTVLALLRGDWKGAWTAIKDTVINIWNNIKAFFEGVDLVQTGKDIIAGLIKGIGSMVSAVGTAARNIGKKVKDTFTSFFSIKSPSRVMRDQVGVHISGGVAAGITKNSKAVTNATKALGKKTEQQFKESFNSANYRFKMGEINSSAYVKSLEKVRAAYAKTPEHIRKVNLEIKKVQDAAIKVTTSEAKARQSAVTKINNTVLSASKSFQSKFASINKKLTNDVKKATKEYDKALADRQKSIYSQYGLFDKVEAKAVSKGDLIGNLKSQIASVRQFNGAIAKLAGQAPKKFVDELREMGVGASAEIQAISSMTAPELNQYVKLWREKHKLAKTEAETQLAGLKDSTTKKVAEIRKAASSELNLLKNEYIRKLQTLSGEVAKLGSLKNSGKILGKNSVAGIIEGMRSMKGALAKEAKLLASTITATTKKTLKIKSPSRVMIALAKFVPAGLAKGIDDNIGKVRQASVRLSEAMTPEAPTVSMAYATPSGVHSSLSSAINGTVDVGNSRDDRIADAIESLESKLTNLRIEMNEREFGRAVSDVSTDARDSAVRNGGRRRI